MDPWIGLFVILSGAGISGIAYYHLVSVLPRRAKETNASISIIALRASSWLVIGGLIIMVLGFLYLMGLIPLGK